MLIKFWFFVPGSNRFFGGIFVPKIMTKKPRSMRGLKFIHLLFFYQFYNFIFIY